MMFGKVQDEDLFQKPGFKGKQPVGTSKDKSLMHSVVDAGAFKGAGH